MVCVALHGLTLAGLLSAYHSLNSWDFMPKLQLSLAIYNFLSNLNSRTVGFLPLFRVASPLLHLTNSYFPSSLSLSSTSYRKPSMSILI